MKAGYIFFYIYMALLASLVGASGSFAFKKNKTEHEKRQEQMWLLTFYITLPMFVASAIVAGSIYFGKRKNDDNSLKVQSAIGIGSSDKKEYGGY
jgi:hypothetical protein